MSKVDNHLLHYAVRNTASKITALLLQRGFSADVRRDYDDGDEGLKNALPLHVVLSQLRFNRRKELSAVELVLNLCNIHYYRRRLETLRLIAQNTTEVKREFFNYLKEGKTIEVGALLLVAKSQILSPSTTAKREGEFRSISEMHDFLLNNNKSVGMDETTLVLLEIFNKIGDNLATLLRLDISETCLANCSSQLAASLIKDAGYDVKPTYFYHNHSYTSFCRRAIDECEKTIRTTDMLPSWVKEAALTGLRDKSGSTSHLTYSFLAEILPNMKVSVSQLTPGSASPIPESMTLLHHLRKKTAPFLGTIKRVFRRR
ncbi:uncharacterized protein LOC141644309 [Silene latifolia]|uniref:uncharacterized protein LOC141644309 n=1 Tax=Silene latifolia TaxID=37657 RepID=UPI003D7783B9